MTIDDITGYGATTSPPLAAFRRSTIVLVVVPAALRRLPHALGEAIGWTRSARSEPVGPARACWQPIADAVKLIFKEIIVPTAANGPVLLGPIMTIMPALAASAVIPFGPTSRSPTSMPACCS